MTLPEALALAVQHHRSGLLAKAESLYRQILAVVPQHADALHLLGVIEHQAGRHEEAVTLIRQALALTPHAASFHANLGVALAGLARPEEAKTAYRQSLQLRPDAEVFNNLGHLLRGQGRLDEAVEAYRAALELRPDEAAAQLELALLFIEVHRFAEAEAACRRVMQIQPAPAEAHNLLGIALRGQQRIAEARAAFQRAVELEPDRIELHNNLASLLKDEGDIPAALEVYRRARALKPDDAAVESNRLLTLHYAETDPGLIFHEHRQWGEKHAQPLAATIAPHRNDADPERRLRVGYLSPDFREHAVAHFLEGLLARHDRARFEVFAYANSLAEDDVTRRLRGHVAQWRTVAGLGDEETADLIRRDGIDLLVDLSGHTAGQRLLVFARRPAPVQVTYLGYCDTTGLRAIDYRLTDALADPPGMTDHWHTEKLIRLPGSAWCFQRPDPSPPVSLASESNGITFGCFNALPKITGEMLGLWARLLHAVPGSRLLLKNLGLESPAAQARVRAAFAQAGVGEDRVELRGWVPDAERLAIYGRVDLALDSFPYHGTTTTCEALWMGVPVITLAGQTHVSRVGVSLLSHAGLPELIAATAEEYLELAQRLAGDPARRAELRAGLREQMAKSPLMDAPRLARDIEKAYREMWRAWCAQQCSNPCP